MRFLSFAIFADVPEWRNCQVYVRQFRLATNPARPTGSRGLYYCYCARRQYTNLALPVLPIAAINS